MDFLNFCLSALPYLCLAGTIWLFWPRGGETASGAFGAIIRGSLAWSLSLWAYTNMLSWLDAIGRLPILLFWAIYSLALLCLLIRRKPPSLLKLPKGWPGWIICLICLLTLFTALVYPPSYWDSLSYHLPRVMEWLQNHSLAPYWTPTVRQIGMPPFNAMIALQSLAMNGGDYFVNLAQWLAFLGCIAGVAAITRQLGGDRRCQIVAAFFMATMPSAMMQASNTESSNIVTFWLLAFASLCLEWLNRPDWPKAAAIGLCLGLAILSKGSAYPIALPFVVLIAFFCLRRPRKLFLQGALMALLIVAINLPHLERTYKAYGSIFGGTESNILLHPTPGTFVTNAVYNFLVHEPFILKYGGAGIWQTMASQLGVDESDPEIFPWGGIDNAWKKFKPIDSYGQNSLYALLLLLLLAAILIRRFRSPARYAWLVFGSFFCYCFFLTWHPWTGRIHTSLFALATPVFALFFVSWRKRWEKICVLVLACLSAGYVFCNSERPLLPFWNPEYSFFNYSRDELYITYRPINDEFMGALHYLAERKPDAVALALTDDGFEYPVWAYLGRNSDKMPEIFHWGRGLKPEDAHPEYIWVQNRGTGDAPLAAPFILKRAGDTYKLVYGRSQ